MSIWNQERSTALAAFIKRDSRRSFDDGPIVGLRIQEYWHPDVPPPGSEQEITFYKAGSDSFNDVLEFATLVLLFEWEDDIADSARSTFTLGTPAPIDTEAFVKHWDNCAAKVDGPALTASEIEESFAVSDEWNDKLYIARDKYKYYAVCWSTTA